MMVLVGAMSGSARADAFTGGRAAPAALGAADSIGGGLWTGLAKLQRGLNSSISREFRIVRDTGSSSAIAVVLGIAFLYGVLHAAGPGHGKSVVAAYFVANEARWTSGIVMGGVISLIQGLFAILMVFLFSLLLRWKEFQIQDRGALVEFVSYAIIVAIGGVMLYRAIIRPAHGRHDHGHHDHGHSDHGHHPEHAHRHDHAQAPVAACGHVHGPVAADPKLILAAGLTPCPSAFLILFFALANGAFLVGVAAVLALSIGMGLTVSGIGVLSIVGRGFLKRVFGGSDQRGERLERILAVTGAALIVGFSGLLALNAWAQL
ncbi:MAG TPA: hypothetical protein VNT30_10180 [Stellaceae bacterium]|nr:hypothetical protein [Stellaceae bacterium]